MSRYTCTFAFAALLAACSSSTSTNQKPPGGDDSGAPEGDAGGASSLTVDGPIAGGKGSPWVAVTNFDPSEIGYQLTEYFIEGTAQAYAADGEFGSDGRWAAVPANTEHFKSRIVVYRPTDAKRFNGSVFVEWLNVSGGVDAAPDWTTAHVELARKGYAYVGVSAQKVGVEGGGSLLPVPGVANTSLKGYDPERYGSLHHPGDSYSYDIFTQVGRLLRKPGAVDPLEGLEPERIIAAGESQSAFRMVTYINAIQPLTRVYDAFLVHSRGGGGAALSENPEPSVPVSRPAFIREDIGVPVLTFQTETDLITLGFLPDRQPDSEFVRLWEVAGTAHADTYLLQNGAEDRGDDPKVAEVTELTSTAGGIMNCETPVNAGPQHFVLKAAVAALENWQKTGNAPAEAPRLSLTGNAFDVDEHGNAKGGIRTPYVDVPVATLSGLGQTGSGFCGIFGTTVLFDAEKLADLYPTHADYVSKVNAATDEAVEAGYILEPDAALIRAAAEQSSIGK